MLPTDVVFTACSSSHRVLLLCIIYKLHNTGCFFFELWSGGYFYLFLFILIYTFVLQMPQLDIITLFDQFFVTYFLFIILHFFISVGPVPTIFEVLYIRHLLFEEFLNTNFFFSTGIVNRSLRSQEQELALHKLTNSFSVQ